MDWRHNAACRDVDPELFFPIGNTGPALLQIDEAKRVCHRCPVMESCLHWAINSGQEAVDKIGRIVRGAPHLLFRKQLNSGSLYPAAYEVCVYPLAELHERQIFQCG